MKKYTFVKAFTAASILASLAGCSSASSAASTAASSSSSAEVKTVIVATSPDYPPYESLTADNQMEGFDIDMTEWIFAYLNENGYAYSLEWKQMSFDTIVSAVQTDQVDLGIAGFTYDEERKVLFSDPYYDSAEVAITAADSDLSTTDDLKNKKIGAQMGTTGEDCANSIEGAEVTAIEDMGVCVETLKAGGLDAVIMDVAVAENYVATGNFKMLDGTLMDEENYIIAKEGNTELMDVINEAIAAFKESDDFKTLEQKWFGSEE